MHKGEVNDTVLCFYIGAKSWGSTEQGSCRSTSEQQAPLWTECSEGNEGWLCWFSVLWKVFKMIGIAEKMDYSTTVDGWQDSTPGNCNLFLWGWREPVSAIAGCYL